MQGEASAAALHQPLMGNRGWNVVQANDTVKKHKDAPADSTRRVDRPGMRNHDGAPGRQGGPGANAPKKDEYKELLKSIKALAEEIRKGEAVDPRINSEGKKALYDNLGKNVDLALMLNGVIEANAAHGFRTSEVRKKKLLIAIKNALAGTVFDAEKILNIVIHNPEFGN